MLPLAGCKTAGTIDDGGIYTVRSSCPQVAIPAGTGDITLFNPGDSREAGAVDVTAAITNVRATCTETAGEFISTAVFQVVATRRDAGAARQVVLPYFDIAMQAGNQVVAKKLAGVAINFPAGSNRAITAGQGTVRISRAAATLPESVRKVLTARRRVGDTNAAIDPLTDPTIRDAVARATFQHLVGFQLSQDQLRYNATR
ncbi:hypothetical protein G7078_08310 [Sphingomonas sinipercae]|uniref:Uncharacterized protein n=2 Tax=Sphingomonas sinipercae TaxID=2714944 RepID=A0A6G7ZQU8_9SPHN|nr:hypothetical protein G7078_08310 [Sphingomonas sinipercae]